MLSSVQNWLNDRVRSDWGTRWDDHGERVALYREYEAGDHRSKLTAEMSKMLRIDSTLDQFNMNYCELVIQSMVDRLQVMGIRGDSEQAQAWADEVLELNRFDALQLDLHEAVIRDGDAFVMVWYDEARGGVTLSVEEIWDGETGVIPVYDRTYTRMIAALKVWYEVGDTRRANLYTPDELYQFDYDGGEIEPLRERGERLPMPGFVPLVHFRNRGKNRRDVGRSELVPVIPLQDVINRALYSMVATSELTSFGMWFAKGWGGPPSGVAPGVIVSIEDDDPAILNAIDFRLLEQGQIAPFIQQLSFLIDKIGEISRTPLVSGGTGESGEALKERQSGLLGKVKRFQVKAGNKWEDVLYMAAVIQNIFGARRAPESRWRCEWRDAQLRNDAETAQLIKAFEDRLSDREILRKLGTIPLFDYQEDEIERVMSEREAESAAQVQQALGNIPNYGAFSANGGGA